MVERDIDDIHERLLKNEFKVEEIEKDLDNLHNDNREIHEKLSEISKGMFQVKWLVIGAVSALVTTETGIWSALLKVLI